jgi:8-oxo-dGTP pyrophosphatase MutT (NUDIX family)
MIAAGDFTHAGGVVYRRRPDGNNEVLLVRGKSGGHEWVLPKGHIEPSESPRQTARREVLEEAGVVAEPYRELGRTNFVSPKGEAVKAVFFLMSYQGMRPPKETRDICWCGLDEAVSLTPFENLRALLTAAKSSLVPTER